MNVVPSGCKPLLSFHEPWIVLSPESAPAAGPLFLSPVPSRRTVESVNTKQGIDIKMAGLAEFSCILIKHILRCALTVMNKYPT